jgi:hypothetical protein
MAKMIAAGKFGMLAALGLLLAVSDARSAEPSSEPDPANIVDPVEREFQSRLQDLRDHQRAQTRQLQNRKDLTPEQRLEKRRSLIAVHQKELHALESEYQGKLSPEARSRWMERKATRQKKFDRLHKTPRDSSKTAKTPPKSGGR